VKRLLPAIAAFSVLLISPASAAASRTFDLLNLLAVSGHINDYGTNPNTVSDAQYLGITKWRDGVSVAVSNLAIYRALYNNGISIIGLPWPVTTPSISTNIGYAEGIAALGPGALFALEGPNEPGNFPFVYGGVNSSTSWSAVAGFQKDWYAAVKADTNLAGIPVWTPSLVGAELDNWGLQFLVVPTPPPAGMLSAAGTVFADALNMHVYPMYSGAAQSIDPVHGDYFVTQLTGDFVTTYAHGFAGYTLGQATAKIRAITEFGYPAIGGTPNGVTVDVATQGKNILNGLMNAWNEGYIAFCIYTFYEQGDGFGLLTGPGNPKVSGTYVHNFTTPLKDTEANAGTFTPGALGYSLSGLPATGKSLLFQKSNGDYDLVIWNNVTNWDFSAGTPITILPTNVDITFGSTQGVLNVYDPVVSSTPILMVSNTNTVSVVLKDYPIVVEALSASVPEAPEKSQ
jgi:hypothetical protein